MYPTSEFLNLQHGHCVDALHVTRRHACVNTSVEAVLNYFPQHVRQKNIWIFCIELSQLLKHLITEIF